MKNKYDVVKIIGFAATILGLASTMLTGWSQQRAMEQAIDEKVDEALANRLKEEEGESE